MKSEELKNLELPDEDDDVGGWAGYHEEVDYSKKVVFDDSSDDDEKESHQEHQHRPPKRKEVQSTNREARMVCTRLSVTLLSSCHLQHEAPPLTALEQPHLLAEQSSKHLHATPVDLQFYHQQHSQPSGSHYPIFYAPQRGYPITVASRPDKERPHPLAQSDPIWQQNRRGPKVVPPPESAWGEDKLATSPAVTPIVHNEQMESIQQQLEQTTLDDNESNAVSAEKKHVTFHLDQQQPAAPPAARQPLKIMMRDMKVSTRDEHDQSPATEMFHPGNMGKPPYHHRSNDIDHQHVSANIDKSLSQQQKVSAWKAATDRGPITTPRTLYEPEGDKSAKKFNALIKQTSSERGKRSSVSDTAHDVEQVQSPSGEIKILKSEEKQSKGRQQTTATSDEVTTAHNKTQQTKSKTTETSSTTTTKKSSKRERPGFRQYQPPPAREQDEQTYPEGKGTGRRPPRHDHNYEQQQPQGDNKGQRRRDRQQSDGKHQSEGKYHSESKYQSERRYSSDTKHQTEGKPHSEGKQHSEGKRQHVDSSNRRDSRSRKDRETSKELPSSTHEQTEQAVATDASKDDTSKPVHAQDDKTTKQSGKEQLGKDSHSKTGNSSGDGKHRKKSTTSSSAAQKSDTSVTKEKSRSRGGRNRNNDDWYYTDDYYNQWYAGGYDDYYYYYDDYNYYDQRRQPSGRQKQQPYDGSSTNSSKNTSERRDNGGKKSQQQQQQQSDRGGNRPVRTRGGDRKDETTDDKTQHRTTKDKSREVTGEEAPRFKPAEEIDTRDRRRKDNKQYQDSSVDKKRTSRASSGKASSTSQSSVSKSSASHEPSGRGQSRSSNKSVTDRPQQSDDLQHTTVSDGSTNKKEPAIKDKAASAKMANVDINSPMVYVIDEEQAVSASSTPAVAENDDFIRVTSKKEKREMKELEKHRQQEKQRKAEEEENKKKHHSTRKSSQKAKQHHQLQEHSLPHEDQSLSTSWNATTGTTTAVSNASIWTESITNLLNEGVNQTSTYMAATHPPLLQSGDYQLFPTSYSTPSVPLAHLSAAVDSSVAQDMPASASQGHSLSETKATGVGRPDTSSVGHGTIRTDLPLSKSHSSTSVSGAIGRGRGSSSSRAPGSNRGSSLSRVSSKLNCLLCK